MLEWNDHSIICRSRSHLSPDNPLRTEGILSSIHSIEYAAQSMAIHGALKAKRKGNVMDQGVLVSMRGIKLETDRLDTLNSWLIISAQQLLNNPGNMIYSFSVSTDEGPVSTGRLSVVSASEIRE